MIVSVRAHSQYGVDLATGSEVRIGDTITTAMLTACPEAWDYGNTGPVMNTVSGWWILDGTIDAWIALNQ